MKIASTVIAQIKDSPSIQAEIAVTMEVKLSTVARWLREEHEDLTKAAVMQIIRTNLELSDDQILETIHT